MGMHKLFNDDYSGPAPLTEVKERPILFSGPMVCAVLGERKFQTRRIMKPQPADDIKPYHFPNPNYKGFISSRAHKHGSKTAHLCPYGQVGDRLWVRETVAAGACAGGKPSEWAPSFWRREQGSEKNPNGLWYAADGLEPETQISNRGNWKPSIFMPRWASRILLEVTNIRVERLQDISAKDAIAEGVVKINKHYLMDISVMARRVADLDGNYDRDERYYGNDNAPGAFFTYFEKLNGRKAFEQNPWVWVVDFRRIK